MKTQIELLTKYLLSDNLEKVKTVGSYSRAVDSDSEEEENYLNDQGFFGPVAKEIKVGTIKWRIIMTKLVIKTVI